MRQTLADRVEIDSLIMAENKQGYLADARAKLRAGVASMAAAAGMNGTTPLTPTNPIELGDETSAITNRSPSTTNNNYPVPPAKSDAPWVALIALALMGAGAAWWMSQPKSSNGSAQTGNTPAPSVPGTTKSDPNYIQFYKP